MMDTVVDAADGTIILACITALLQWATTACHTVVLLITAVLDLTSKGLLITVLLRDTTQLAQLVLSTTAQEPKVRWAEVPDLMDTSTPTWLRLTWPLLPSRTPSAHLSVLPTQSQWTTLNHPTTLTYKGVIRA